MDSLSAIRLMRSGERIASQAEARLRQDGPNDVGEKRLIKGEPYIAKLCQAEILSLTYDAILVAPSPICRDTLHALFRHSTLAATYVDVREEPRIHTGEKTKEWTRLVATFNAIGEIKTLADLKRAETMASQGTVFAEELLPAGFLQQEGERILRFAVEEVSKFPPASSVLCVMNSPVVEAVWLELWRNSPTAFKEARPLDSIAMLDNLDGITLGILGGKIVYSLEYRYEEKIRKIIEDEMTTERLKRTSR